MRPEELNRARARRPERFPESGMNEVMLSAARGRQYTTDAYIDGGYHGAMTYFAIQIIRRANYEITYAGFHPPRNTNDPAQAAPGR